MKMSESIVKLSIALVKFRSEIKQPLKDKANPFFKSKYVPLENVVEAIDSVATKHGLSFIQYPVNQDNKVGIITVVIHESGEYLEVEPVFATPVKQDPQAVGSAITYLKRYSLSAVFGITSDEDDDGNNGTGLQQKQPYQAPPKNDYPKKKYEKPHENEVTEDNNFLSDSQLKLIHVKLNIIAKKESKKLIDVQKESYEFCQIKEGKSSKELTKQEASKLIGYLGTLEKA